MSDSLCPLQGYVDVALRHCLHAFFAVLLLPCLITAVLRNSSADIHRFRATVGCTIHFFSTAFLSILALPDALEFAN